MTTFEAIILVMVVIVGVSVVWSTLRLGISPMPSSASARRAMLELVEGEHPTLIYELGSGWGGLAIDLARRYPEIQVVGYEQSFFPWLYATLIKRLARLENLQYRRSNLFEADLIEASHLFCYLYPQGMERLAGILSQHRAQETKLISNTFRLPGFDPLQTIELSDVYGTRVYAYELGTQAVRPQTT